MIFVVIVLLVLLAVALFVIWRLIQEATWAHQVHTERRAEDYVTITQLHDAERRSWGEERAVLINRAPELQPVVTELLAQIATMEDRHQAERVEWRAERERAQRLSFARTPTEFRGLEREVAAADEARAVFPGATRAERDAAVRKALNSDLDEHLAVLTGDRVPAGWRDPDAPQQPEGL